jgi:hypothetical protein
VTARVRGAVLTEWILGTGSLTPGYSRFPSSFPLNIFEQRYIGKTHILTAIDRFHAAHADVALELNVTR